LRWSGALPDILSLVLTVVWLVGITNAINWIDGWTDWRRAFPASRFLVMMIACLAMNQPASGVMAAALAGCCLGFLRYNFNPAPDFYGRWWICFVGYSSGRGHWFGIKGVTTVAVLLPLNPSSAIFDMSAVILDRVCSGKSHLTGQSSSPPSSFANGLSHRRTVCLSIH
jgi:UDP-GlcNAc:undecaprenyl-phosphate GlcNAc-1-phosphate transferase